MSSPPSQRRRNAIPAAPLSAEFANNKYPGAPGGSDLEHVSGPGWPILQSGAATELTDDEYWSLIRDLATD